MAEAIQVKSENLQKLIQEAENRESRREEWIKNFACKEQCRMNPPALPFTEKEFLELFGPESGVEEPGKCPLYSPDCPAGRSRSEEQAIKRLLAHGVPKKRLEEARRDYKPAKKAIEAMELYEKIGLEQGKCLILCGGTGTGKTCAVICLLKEWAKTGKEFLFYYSSSLYNLIRYSEDKGAPIRAANETPLLVIDDLGVEKETDLSKSILDEIINYREGNGLPTIITTNKAKNEITESPFVFGQRVGDRLNGEWAIVCGLAEKSLRGKASA